MPSERPIDGCSVGQTEAGEALTPPNASARDEEQALGDAYAAAWDEWARGDGKLWESTVGDGLDPDEGWDVETRDIIDPTG